jgi:branched-chain amino acid transport system ATP-binding protein
VSPLLHVEHVSKSFGSVRVIEDLTFQLEQGEALGVVGPNGAGKTTMMNLIAGVIPVDAGRLVFEDRDVTRLPPHVRCRVGIGRTHQIPQPFEGLTVLENVLVGLRFGRTEPVDAPYAIVADLLDGVELLSKANALAGSLTLLERKRLELARARATSPRLLLLDEIGGGLTDGEVERLIETIRGLRSAGLTLVWIEHIVHALLPVVDRLLAIDFGRVLKVGEPGEVMASPEVQAVYMGVETEVESE